MRRGSLVARLADTAVREAWSSQGQLLVAISLRIHLDGLTSQSNAGPI